MTPLNAQTTLEILRHRYGPQEWWPAETPFEVVVGALLTQNSAWRNVELAIENLRRKQLLQPGRLACAPQAKVAAAVRPAGYYNVKARRLRHLSGWIEEQGGMAALNQIATDRLRELLLNREGVGPETADSILLYAFTRPVFVIDTYTRRIFSRLGILEFDAPYHELRFWFEAGLGGNTKQLNELHALIVAHGKQYCRPQPRCDGCCLYSRCSVQRRVV